ncbi:MAG: hypothetical protein HC862_00715 [Scytonema sp. RU_4_4]|nr:hypothetical protein [Scytonema sp. RU_4_4]NJR73255.1 hypothetical protein [Scytonema sp. CRU_2_7]
MNTENHQRQTWLLLLLAINIFASILHYTDNFLFFKNYPGLGTNPHVVYIAWLILTPFGLAGYRQYRKGNFWTAYLCLCIYSMTSIGGLAHYLFASMWSFSWKMNALIWFEALAGITLLSFTIYSSLLLKEWRQTKLLN